MFLKSLTLSLQVSTFILNLLTFCTVNVLLPYTGLHAGAMKQLGSEDKLVLYFFFFFFLPGILNRVANAIPVERSVLSSTVLTATGTGGERFAG